MTASSAQPPAATSARLQPLRPGWNRRPIWGVDTQGGGQNDTGVERALARAVTELENDAALKARLAGCKPCGAKTCGLKAIVAGHQHLLQNVVFPSPNQTGEWMLPQQFVVGNSGVILRKRTRRDAFPLLFADGHLSGCPDGYIQGAIVTWQSRYNKDGETRYSFGYGDWTRPAAANGEPSGWSGTARFIEQDPLPLASTSGGLTASCN